VYYLITGHVGFNWAWLTLLGASKAQRELGWRNRLGFRDAPAWTIDWERRVHAGADTLTATREQVAGFENPG
jgi:CDP-glucose 4,6-dehydratase